MDLKQLCIEFVEIEELQFNADSYRTIYSIFMALADGFLGMEQV